MNLGALLDEFREPITRAIVEMYPPQLLPGGPRADGLPPLLRRPKGAQADAIRAAAHSLRRETATTVVGEMGVGKSFVAVAAARQAGFRRPLVVCPPQLTVQWCDEVRRTVPGAQATILRSIADVEQVRREPCPFLVSVLSREKGEAGAAPVARVPLASRVRSAPPRGPARAGRGAIDAEPRRNAPRVWRPHRSPASLPRLRCAH